MVHTVNDVIDFAGEHADTGTFAYATIRIPSAT